VILATGEVAGFSARALPGAEVTAPTGAAGAGDAPAKYINSPESPIYKKSKLLYGVHQARDAMRTRGRAVLVEGNFDVISLHQAGIRETVAPLGTALTDEQVQMLRRLADRVVLLYDGDSAGRAATLKALRVLVAAGVEVGIALLPLGEDPDSFARARGGEALSALFDKPRSAIEYFIEHVWAAGDGSAATYSAAMHEAAALLPAVKDQLRRRHLVDHLAAALRVPVDRVRGDLRAAYRGQKVDSPPASKQESTAKSLLPPTEEMDLLAYLSEFPELMPVAETLDVLSLLTDSRLRDMYSAAAGGQPIWLSPSAIPAEIAAHVLSGSKKSVSHPERALRESVDNLKTRREKQARLTLVRQLEQAERRRDEDLARELYARAREIRQPKE
jgi:DNA primase